MPAVGKNTYRITIGLLLLLLCVVSLSAQELICDYCQKPIGNSDYYIANGKYYHEDHLKCDHCGQSIKGVIRSVDDKFYHTSCYQKHIALRCDLCGEPINGEYLIDPWGTILHRVHRDQGAPKCEHCGRYIGEEISKGGYRLDDGRVSCGICNETALFDSRQAHKLMSEVRGKMLTLGLRVDIANVSLSLVNKDVMDEKSDGDGDKNLGLTKSRYDSKTRKLVGESNIYILSGLPKYSFIKVMAHELMHVWMAENRCVKGSQVLSEGSCNYAAYLVLQKYNHPGATYEIDAMTRNRSRTYGAGFRAVKAFVDEKGFAYWLEYIKSNKRLPNQ